MKRRSSAVPVLSFSVYSGHLPWLLLPLSYLLGGLIGHLLSGTGVQEITGFLEDYTASLLTGTPQADPVGLLLWMGRYLLLAALLSCSTIGIVGLPLLLGVHGFSTGYAISAFYRTWGYAGLRSAALWVAVIHGILLALLLAVSIPGWNRSWELCSGRRQERTAQCQRRGDQVCFCLIGMAAAVLYEFIVSHFAALVF